MTVNSYLEQAAAVVRRSISDELESRVSATIDVISQALSRNLPLLVCGNGGSASDAMHIAGELVGRFLKERRALNCICLSSNPAVLTAWSNDYSYDTVFSRQVEAYGAPGGVLLGISTSGNSENVVRAVTAAKAIGMTTVCLTGQGGGRLASASDILLEAASSSTPEIQQVHVCLYHYVCQEVEQRLSA